MSFWTRELCDMSRSGIRTEVWAFLAGKFYLLCHYFSAAASKASAHDVPMMAGAQEHVK